MQHIDQVASEIQKDFFRALIENITVFEDKIAMNMFIPDPTLPNPLLNLPNKDKSPTPILNQDEANDTQLAVASGAAGSTGRQVWGE